MTGKPMRCRIGWHDRVRRHPPDERMEGPDQQVCRRCGVTAGGVPPAVFG